jgi:hypothetical protein
MIRSRGTTTHGAQAVNLFEIEIGRSYRCDLYGVQYFGTVKEKRDGQIGVALGNKVGTDSDPGDPVATRELTWLAPEHIHPL